MARYWVRVRAEYVVPVFATSREDAMGLEAGDLCDEMTPERLYASEVIGAVPDSERHLYDCGGLQLDAEQRAEDDRHAAMLLVGERVRMAFCDVPLIDEMGVRGLIAKFIRGIAEECAHDVILPDAEDYEPRIAACVIGICAIADKSAATYIKWRTA
jgi:hypothetical protein